LRREREKKFLFRTAASFVAAYAGISSRPMLSGGEVAGPGRRGGLLVVGSHVGRTSLQLDTLFAARAVGRVELAVGELFGKGTRPAEIARVLELVRGFLERGETAVLYTSRHVVTGGTSAENLRIGEIVSGCLVEIVAALPDRPRWLVAKGGITSSDLATKALGARRALVLGQVMAGVPVWQLEPGSRWPGLNYVVFPGNVGDGEALSRLVRMLEEARA
jgi:uncharacterized protein YgbK (DUF1537 family)